MTITKLAKLAGISRPTIYKYFKDHGYDRKNITEKVAQEVIDYFSQREKSRKKIETASKKSCVRPRHQHKKLSNEEVETVKERLINAKSDYNFNASIIARLKNEIDQYVSENNCTTYTNNSGGTTSIPQIRQLENYEKLNIALNKTIQELEESLDMIKFGGNNADDNPFS